MDRRLFLLSTLALAGCDSFIVGPQMAICDPDLVNPLLRARMEYGEGGIAISDVGPREMLAQAEDTRSALVVTRQSLIANRLQRLGIVRLEHRWQARIAGGPAEILVTKGSGPVQWRALDLAKWLASDAAAAALANGEPLITAP